MERSNFTLYNLLFKSLKSVTILFKPEFFLEMSMMGEEIGDMSNYKTPNVPTFAFLYQSLVCLLL